MGKAHQKRYIIEFKHEGKWYRSGNGNHMNFFATKEQAQAALTPQSTNDGFKYRVRSK